MASAQPEKRRRSQLRPCIDLHEGVVKQIVGGTLDLDAAGPSSSAAASSSASGAPSPTPAPASALKTNFVATQSPAHFAKLYRAHGLTGGHVIKLGRGNDAAARAALAAWPGALQVGGGITRANAREWLDAGAEKVIVTSALFPGGKFSEDVLREIAAEVGKDRLVVDISCRKRASGWIVAMNGWKTLTDLAVTAESVRRIEAHCAELLVHAADVEGLCQGIDEELVARLGEWVSIPCTYAGGAKDIDDLARVDALSHGKVDLTFGSSLDIFGGAGVRFDELVDRDREAKRQSAEAA
ncbi:Enzyme that catalyzes the fourth step in the histidine pathway [Cryptotrichosporon argae]